MGNLCYYYYFCYEGKGIFGGKKIKSASMGLVFEVYKKEKLVKFVKEESACCDGYSLRSVFDVFFDRECREKFRVSIDCEMYNLFCRKKGWDRISYRVKKDGFCFSYKKNENIDVEDEFAVTQKEFIEFLESDLDGFDISDNKKLQVLSYTIEQDGK